MDNLTQVSMPDCWDMSIRDSELTESCQCGPWDVVQRPRMLGVWQVRPASLAPSFRKTSRVTFSTFL
jgi:hypothetical protein